MRERLRAVVTAYAVACLLGTATAARAQGNAEVDRDVQELKQYRLSMPKVKQMAAATLAFAKEMEKDPTASAIRRLDREIETLRNKTDRSDSEEKQLEALEAKRETMDQAQGADEPEEDSPRTLADMERRIGREPRLAAAITGAGMTAREYSLVTLSFFQAMFTHMMQKSGSLKEMPKDVPVDNVTFVQQHEAELMQIFSELQAHDQD